jgi:membrane-bound lytic murein transglycosylase B
MLAASVVTALTACTGGTTAPRLDRGIEPAEFAAGAPLVEAVSDAPLAFSETVDAEWVGSVAAETGIPERALRAYAGAAINSNRENPACAASWNTLAGIGFIESRHGEVFDGSIDANGTVSPPVYGVPLDGDGVASIPDSDGGAIDGDATVDRAVGPMQMIPGAWRNWHVDANRDGVEDPQNIDDAALAAVHYLCRAGGDLSTRDGWRTGILAWNHSETYLQDVAGWANRYAEEAAAA